MTKIALILFFLSTLAGAFFCLQKEPIPMLKKRNERYATSNTVFVVHDLQKGAVFDSDSVRLVSCAMETPDDAASPDEVLGKKARHAVQKGVILRRIDIDPPPLKARTKAVRLLKAIPKGAIIQAADVIEVEALSYDLVSSSYSLPDAEYAVGRAAKTDLPGGKFLFEQDLKINKKSN